MLSEKSSLDPSHRSTIVYSAAATISSFLVASYRRSALTSEVSRFHISFAAQKMPSTSNLPPIDAFQQFTVSLRTLQDLRVWDSVSPWDSSQSSNLECLLAVHRFDLQRPCFHTIEQNGPGITFDHSQSFIKRKTLM